MVRTVGRFAIGLVLAAGLLAGVGCRGKASKVYPVKGQVHVNGAPAAGARVVFHPVDGNVEGPKPSAIVQDDGSFALTTPKRGKGAPAGEYVVAIAWLGDKASASASGEVPSKLPERYADPARSPLRATITAGPTDLEPFDIRTK